MIAEGEMWLKGRGWVDTLCRGEVAEWLNAAVSKTVTSVIPASGVRIPPSPRFRASQHGALQTPCQLVSFSHSSLILPRTTDRYQRQSSSAFLARPRNDLLKC
jgi:hypothetical protein